MRGPFPYIGGKSRLAAQLIAWFPPHTTYVEPFCGGAQVFFQKPPSRVETINDLDGEVVNFLRICQHHHEELIRCVRFTVTSRRWYELFKRQDPDTLTDIQRAARFLYIRKNTYAGRVRSPTFNANVLQAGRFKPSQIAELLAATAKRLERVQIENRDVHAVLDEYDRPSTLFYLDPPYVAMPFYRFNFADADFDRLATRLATLRGKFLLSINDHPRAREAFRAFQVREVSVLYSIRGKDAHPHELVFSNFDLATTEPVVGDTNSAIQSGADGHVV